MDEFWGRSPSEWTAIGTVVIAAATLVYIGVTIFLAIMARSSAKSAEASAQAAQEAAEATTRAARVAEAALDRTFRVTYTGIPGGDSILHVHGARSALYVHGLLFRGGYFTEVGHEDPTGFYRARTAAHVRDRYQDQHRLPRLLHSGEVIPFVWPFGVVDAAKPFIVYCAVLYSVDREGAAREVMVQAENTSPRPKGGAMFV